MAFDEVTWELNLAHAVEWAEFTGEIPRGRDHAAQWVAMRRSEFRRGVRSSSLGHTSGSGR